MNVPLTLNKKLVKGETLTLNKESGFPDEFIIGLGWDTNRTDTGKAFDLDAAIILVGDNGQVLSKTDWSSVVFYHNQTAAGFQHSGDNQTGDADGDDEAIATKLPDVSQSVKRIVVTASIFAGTKRKQNFGQVDNAYVRLVNPSTGQEILRYDLTEDFSQETAVIFAEIYRYNGQWKMKAVGSGYKGGFSTLLAQYGMIIAEETDE